MSFCEAMVMRLFLWCKEVADAATRDKTRLAE